MADKTLETTVEWRALAKIDPLYVVATWPDKRGSWTPDEFYAAGTSDWQDFERHWLHYWPELGGSCLEIGCGAGRITQALAARFDHVIALDVSEDMITLAEAVAPENVEFRLVEGTQIPLPSASVDAVFTCHVLQHLEGLAQVTEYLTEARRVMRPGAGIMVQLGLHGTPMRFHGRMRQNLALWIHRRSRRLRPNLDFRVKLYRWDEVKSILEQIGFQEIELRMFAVRSNRQLQAFWLARNA